MLFNSYLFIFLFLPLCLAGFYILKQKYVTMAKVWLTGFSLWFYGYFNQYYLLIMLCSIMGNYFIHCKIMQARERGTGTGKRIMTTGIVLNLAVLFYFKYFDFFLENVNQLFGSSIPLRNILLPLGISFFTFQQISFLADSYRGELDQYKSFAGKQEKARVSLIDYSLFVSFFPQLIAGPIVVHEEMMPQFARIGNEEGTKEEKAENFIKGIYVFVLGLAKKVIIADTFSIAVDLAYGDVYGLNATESLLTILFYSLQLYFDFSGYCDMAKGIAGMFGMKIATNFNSPYKSANIVEFWKRWHITLSRFFTQNIYIPLGGNRKGEFRMYLNYFIVFFLSGLWHGAGWNFIVWGILHGSLYILTKWQERNNSRKGLKNDAGPGTGQEILGGKNNRVVTKVRRALGCILTFVYVSIAWVYFRAYSVEQANALLGNVLKKSWDIPRTGIADGFNLGEFWYLLKVVKVADWPYAQYYLMILFTVTTLGIVFFGKNLEQLEVKWKPTVINAVITAVFFVWSIVSLSGVSTFLYFNF